MPDLKAPASAGQSQRREGLPHDLAGMFQEAISKLKVGDYDRAKQLFTAILYRVPTHSPTLKNLALTYFKHLDFVAAEAVYRQAVSLSPGDVDALQGLATSVH